jgi:hypothetical protein
MAEAVAAGNGSLVTSPAGMANGARGKGGSRAAGSIEKDADSPRLFVGQVSGLNTSFSLDIDAGLTCFTRFGLE